MDLSSKQNVNGLHSELHRENRRREKSDFLVSLVRKSFWSWACLWWFAALGTLSFLLRQLACLHLSSPIDTDAMYCPPLPYAFSPPLSSDLSLNSQILSKSSISPFSQLLMRKARNHLYLSSSFLYPSENLKFAARDFRCTRRRLSVAKKITVERETGTEMGDEKIQGW